MVNHEWALKGGPCAQVVTDPKSKYLLTVLLYSACCEKRDAKKFVNAQFQTELPGGTIELLLECML
jgi:hypothetical protein